MRNPALEAVLLRRDGAKREVPLGGWAAPEDLQRVLRASIQAAWPDRELMWPAFLKGGAVLRIRDADVNNWLLRALCNALTHGVTVGGTRCRRSPSHHASDDAGDGRAKPARPMSARGWGGDSAAGRPPQRGRAPRPAA